MAIPLLGAGDAPVRAATAEGRVDLPPEGDPRLTTSKRLQRRRFLTLAAEQQTALFVSELPTELRRAPHIDWALVTPRIKAQLLYATVATSPEKGWLALLAGVLARDGYSNRSIEGGISAFVLLWANLSGKLGISSSREMTWDRWEDIGRWITSGELGNPTVDYLWKYSTLVSHLHDYWQSLRREERPRLAEFLFPEMPGRFADRFDLWNRVHLPPRQRRKAKTDVLAPIATILVGLVLQRKKAAEQFLHWFRTHVGLAEAGELPLPAQLVYEATEYDVNRDARSPAEIHWVQRPVRMELTLWTPETYLDAVARQGQLTRRRLKAKKAVVAAKGTTGFDERYFLEPTSDPAAGPWFMPAVIREAFSLRTKYQTNQEYKAPNGLGAPDPKLNLWLKRQAGLRALEPEAVYRAVLFGTTLTVLGLTSAGRLSELLQISADRFEPPRLYVVKDEHGNPVIDDETNQPKTEVILLQRLLAKGYRHESERKLFNLTGARDLLMEISVLLMSRHSGAIPVVAPSACSKAEYLTPERYLLQWDGRALADSAANALIQFMTEGIQFRDRLGRPFEVTSHLLRHVAVTVARQDYGLPAEAVAQVLHHRHQPGEVPEVTEYYSRLPEDRWVEHHQTTVRAWLDDVQLTTRALVPVDAAEELRALLTGCDEKAREVVEQWHTYHPVVFGLCGWPNLCVRGTVRVLCLGCPHLIPRPEHRAHVEVWRHDYADQAAKLEQSGNFAEAQEHRRLAAHCAQLSHEMELLGEAERGGNWVPLYRRALTPASAIDDPRTRPIRESGGRG